MIESGGWCVSATFVAILFFVYCLWRMIEKGSWCVSDRLVEGGTRQIEKDWTGDTPLYRSGRSFGPAPWP